MEVLFNKEGYPLTAQCSTAFVDIVRSAKDSIRKRDILQPLSTTREEAIVYNNMDVLSWGKSNDFPFEASRIIASTSVLNTGLKFLRQLTIGQGLYPCKVTGYDAKGNEQLSAVDDPELVKLMNGRMVRKYLEKVSRDYFKFGVGYVLLTPNANGKIIGLQPINALFVRLTKPDSTGIGKAIVSGGWPTSPGVNGDKPVVYDCLLEYDPSIHLDLLRKNGRLNRPVMYCVRDTWSNNDIYSEPVWLPAYLLGWIDVAHLVPHFLKHAYENQVTWKWHVQIPYSYWEKRFPADDPRFDTPTKRELAIKKAMDEIENNLCGTENAEKPLVTHYATNEANGKNEEEWKITALDNKYKGGDNLVTSAAANSEILFSLMVNPNVMGMGMPGGSYAGNQGGSNIREAFLVNIANAWIDRQTFLDPIYLLLSDMGYDCEIRYRNTVLTTLDTGAGTQKTLS